MALVKDEAGMLIFYCPCGLCGEVRIKKNRWKLSGTPDAPTITPSINTVINPSDHPHYNPEVKTSRCHILVQDGKIHYLDDCTHALAGKTIDLPELP